MNPTHGNTAGSKLINAPHSRSFSGPFGRMFRILPVWEPKGETEEAKLADIERIAVQMGPVNPAANNKKIPAGYTYFGQFVDHDLTFDPRSSLQKHNDPENLEDFRSPAFDLDCLYGRGPADQPYMYGHPNDPDFGPDTLRFDNANLFGEEDLPRLGARAVVPPANITEVKDNELGYLTLRAVLGDKRNDENTFVSQLQLIFIKFHNAVLNNKDLVKDGVQDRFAEAQRVVRWHYQWVVVHDWLKRLCGKKFVDDILNGGGYPGKPKLRFYSYHQHPFMPVEFSVAAYRLGHSMIRGRYSINEVVRDTLGPLPTFDRAADRNLIGDFRGFRPLPKSWTIDWSFFFKFTTDQADPAQLQFSSPLDKSLSQPLIAMPDAIANPDEVPAAPPPDNPIKRSLAYRNLLRSWRLGLPSGESVAKMIGVTKDKTKMDLSGNTPLWRYILDEAEADGGSEQLGMVGATIVAETFIGLLAADPSSYYRIDPDWTPNPAIPVIGDGFQLRDIIKFAGGKIGPPKPPQP